MLLFLCQLTICCWTQQKDTAVIVKGAVLDSASRQPVRFATVSVYQHTGKLLQVRVADTAGAFTCKGLAPGKYEIRISAAGYQPGVDSFIVASPAAVIPEKNILISRVAKQLKEVIVSAEKPIVRQEIDRLIYNVDLDPENKTSNVIDVMRKVPLLSVDAEDNLLLAGKGNFRVMIDGKTSVILGKNIKNVLRSMPAASIQKIEVITIVPSKYEAEGLSGIINIVTNRKRTDGYLVALSGNYGTLNSTIGSSVNITKGKWGTDLFIGHYWEREPAAPFSNFLAAQPASFSLHQEGHRSSRGRSIFSELTTSYEIDSLNLLTVNIGLSEGSEKNFADQFSKLMAANESEQQSYQLDELVRSYDKGMEAGANYQKGFPKNKNQLFTLFYKYTRSVNDYDGLSTFSRRYNYSAEDFSQGNSSVLNEHLAQADYFHKIKSWTIEAGVKNIYRDNASHFNLERFEPLSGKFIEDPHQANSFNYSQNITGIYNSWFLQRKYFGLKFGVRLEQTINRAEFISSKTSLDQDYLNLLPSVSLQKLFRNNNINLRLGYTLRLKRPGIGLLNPFTDQSDPRFYYSGNPDLQPVKSHQFEFVFYSPGKSTITLNMGYSFSKNTVQRIAELGEDSITRSTYQNVGKDDNISLNMNLSIPVSKSITITANGGTSYCWLKGQLEEERISNQGLQGFLYSYLNYKATKNWKVSARTGFFGPKINLQGKSNAYFFSSIIVNRQIPKINGALSLSFNNPFQKYRKVVNSITSPHFNQEFIDYRNFRNFSIGFSCRFGEMKGEVKKNKRNIVNDDKVTVEAP